MKKLIVITTPRPFPQEGKVITRLFEEGMERLHLRKPLCPAEELSDLLDDIPLAYYPRIVLHDCFDIATARSLGGIHLNRRNPQAPDGFSGSISRSCHRLQEVAESGFCQYVFLSSIFDSISKEGYGSAFSAKELKEAASRGVINEKVFALGGIDTTTLRLLEDLPFGGVAVLGALWGDDASLQQSTKIIQHLKQIQHVLR